MEHLSDFYQHDTCLYLQYSHKYSKPKKYPIINNAEIDEYIINVSNRKCNKEEKRH